jgi:hypothetical protein
MPVVDEVGVVAVADRHVPAVRTMDVVVDVVRHVGFGRALVPMVGMGPVGMAVMQIVGVVAVFDGDVPAPRAVFVAVLIVGAVSCGGHG